MVSRCGRNVPTRHRKTKNAGFDWPGSFRGRDGKIDTSMIAISGFLVDANDEKRSMYR